MTAILDNNEPLEIKRLGRLLERYKEFIEIIETATNGKEDKQDRVGILRRA